MKSEGIIDRITYWVAQVLSYLLYPLFIPTYATILVCIYLWCQDSGMTFMTALPFVGWTFALTFVLPMVCIAFLWHKGKVSSLQMADKNERGLPYLAGGLSMAVWWLFLYLAGFPAAVCMTALMAVLTISIVGIINIWWKISIHLASWGVLTGGVVLWTLQMHTTATGLLTGLMLTALVLMFARLRLNAHTPMQVVCGYLLGLCTGLLPLFWMG